jgi:drug/metabolite transporter (DMT)-like permease
MVSLLYDKDVQSLILTVVFVLAFNIINHYKLKTKENWRFWFGIILISMGASSIVLNFNEGSASILAGVFFIIIGFVLWLYKGK